LTYSKGYGLKPKTEDRRDFVARAPRAYTGEFVDLSDGFPDPPYDQLNLGSCVSNAVAAATDYARKKQGLPPLRPPSRLFVYYNGRAIEGDPTDQDTGLQIRAGFKSLAQCGAPPESDWPYDVSAFAHKPTARAYQNGKLDEAVVYGAVPDSHVDDMIASGWPVVIGWDVYSSFESDETAATGIMPMPDTATEQPISGHSTVTVSTPLDGSDPRVGGVPGLLYRKERNSWGHAGDWGIPAQPGYFWMPVPYMDGRHASDFWVVKTVTADNPPVPPTPTPPVESPPFLVLLSRFLIGWLRRLLGHG
jgi:hypothetical protein